jgi:serine/threonine-protein kinase RsbW
MVSQGLRLAIRNDLAEIPQVTEAIRIFSEKSELPQDLNFTLQLVAEELLSNIIRYGYPDQGSHRIQFDVQSDSDEVSIVVQDDGIPFNLLEYPAPKKAANLDELKVGGLGIHLVRKMMDEITYRREDGQNTLLLKKKLKPL